MCSGGYHPYGALRRRRASQATRRTGSMAPRPRAKWTRTRAEGPPQTGVPRPRPAAIKDAPGHYILEYQRFTPSPEYDTATANREQRKGRRPFTSAPRSG